MTIDGPPDADSGTPTHDDARDVGSLVRRMRRTVGVVPKSVAADVEALEEVAPQQEDRREIIEALVGFGLSTDEATTAVDTGGVPLALLRKVLDRGATMDGAQLSARAGVPLSVLEQIRGAMGLPTTDQYTEADLDAAQAVHELLLLFPAEAVIRTSRIRRVALQQVIANDLALIRDELVLPMRAQGVDDLAVAMALADTAATLEGIVRALLVANYEQVLRHMLSSELTAVAARGTSHDVELAVGFVDLVGYSALSNRIDPDGLDVVLDAFETRVFEVTSRHPDVGVVKFLGDAAMLVSSDPLAMADAVFELCREVPELADAPLRGGFAHGRALVREGDYFGQPVNLAARLTDVGRPWAAITSEDLGELVGSRYTTRQLRPVRLRGFPVHRPVLLEAPREGIWAEP